MNIEIVFSDIDGTLLNSRHQMLPGTLRGIHALQANRIPFVIVSARSPGGIRPILQSYGFTCPMICFSGALTLGQDGQVLDSVSFPGALAVEVIQYLESQGLDCTWNLFSGEQWLVRDCNDPRVMLEESIVRTRSSSVDVASLSPDLPVHKLLLMCNPEALSDITEQLKQAFPGLSILPSSASLLEIMTHGVGKGRAVEEFCRTLHILPAHALAFGDHWNDVDMLSSVGHPILMGNAPPELLVRFQNHTASNDYEGIWRALVRLGLA